MKRAVFQPIYSQEAINREIRRRQQWQRIGDVVSGAAFVVIFLAVMYFAVGLGVM